MPDVHSPFVARVFMVASSSKETGEPSAGRILINSNCCDWVISVFKCFWGLPLGRPQKHLRVAQNLLQQAFHGIHHGVTDHHSPTQSLELALQRRIRLACGLQIGLDLGGNRVGFHQQHRSG